MPPVAGKRRKTSLVPRIVLGASFVSVVPACVAACSGGDPIFNLGNQFGVAAVAFCCFDGGGVAADAFFFDATKTKDAMFDVEAASPDDAADAGDEAGDATDDAGD